MVMKIYNQNRDADPSEYMDIAKGCVEGFLQMVMKSLWFFDHFDDRACLAFTWHFVLAAAASVTFQFQSWMDQVPIPYMIIINFCV